MLERVWRKRKPLHCWWEYKLVQPLWRTVWRFLKKLNLELPYDPSIPFLGIYLEKSIIWKDTCRVQHVFIAVLFTIAKTWKQPKYLLTEDWIKKIWYIHTMEYYSAIKKNEIMAFAAIWMDLEIMMLSEVRQWDTNITCYHLYLQSKKRTQWTSLQNRYWLTDFEKLVVSKGDSLGSWGMGWVVMIVVQL